MYEKVRKSLENCDVDKDIKLFISTRQTGAEKPGMLTSVVCFLQDFYQISYFIISLQFL
jgi:hypothetical protein